MGGIGSGGHNRKSAEEHKKRGTFQKVRHGDPIGEIVPIPTRAPADVPDAPVHLGPTGRQLWVELWTHLSGIHDRDRSLIEQCCEGADQQRAAYLDWSNSRTKGKGGILGPANPHLAKVLFDARKSWRQDMALLGMTARDRAAMTKHAAPESSIEQLKRKVLQLRQPG